MRQCSQQLACRAGLPHVRGGLSLPMVLLSRITNTEKPLYYDYRTVRTRISMAVQLSPGGVSSVEYILIMFDICIKLRTLPSYNLALHISQPTTWSDERSNQCSCNTASVLSIRISALTYCILYMSTVEQNKNDFW